MLATSFKLVRLNFQVYASGLGIGSFPIEKKATPQAFGSSPTTPPIQSEHVQGKLSSQDAGSSKIRMT